MAEITIPENKETGGASSSCMNCARSICRGIQNSPCNRLFESDAWQIFVWAIRILLIASSSAVIHYRSEFEGIPEVITAYCTGVIMCAIFSIIPRGGYLMFDYLYGSGSFRTQSEGKLVEVSGGGHSAKNNEKTSIPTWYSPQMIEKIRKIASKQIPGTDLKKLEEFSRHYRSTIGRIVWIILSNSCSNHWPLKDLTSSFLNKICRQYIAVFMLIISVYLCIVAVIDLRGVMRIVIGFYCFALFVCSLWSLFIKRGLMVCNGSRYPFFFKLRSELREDQQLLEQSNPRDRQEANQPAGYNKYEWQALQSASENLFKPRKEAEVAPASRKKFQIPSFHRSKSFSTSNYSSESFAGVSYAPDPFSPLNYSSDNSFGRTLSSADSYDYQTSRHFSVAHISAKAIKAFGPPAYVFGADSYCVPMYSMDESCSSDEPVAEEVRKFEVSVEVHHPDSYCPLNTGESSSAELETEV